MAARVEREEWEEGERREEQTGYITEVNKE